MEGLRPQPLAAAFIVTLEMRLPHSKPQLFSTSLLELVT